MTDRGGFAQYRPHPCHGLAPGGDPPHLLQAYIEITPFDSIKCEIDKVTGYLNDKIWGAADDIIDIPQRFVERPEHYFSIYKMVPGHPSTMVFKEVYGVAHGEHVVMAPIDDYDAEFGQEDGEDR